MTSNIQIAIDGPVAAGKSTVAQKVAQRLKFLYVDTGAMYRAVALASEKSGLPWGNKIAISNFINKINLRLTRPTGKKKDGRNVTVYLNNKDVSWNIRNAHIGEGASIVSQYPRVRSFLVKLQQNISLNHSVVMEGRDIGTRVLPKANLKIYMDADIKKRVRRKYNQLKSFGQTLSLKSVQSAIITRDNREMSRKIDPLKPAKNAWILDTTNLSVKKVVDIICQKIASH